MRAPLRLLGLIRGTYAQPIPAPILPIDSRDFKMEPLGTFDVGSGPRGGGYLILSGSGAILVVPGDPHAGFVSRRWAQRITSNLVRWQGLGADQICSRSEYTCASLTLPVPVTLLTATGLWTEVVGRENVGNHRGCGGV